MVLGARSTATATATENWDHNLVSPHKFRPASRWPCLLGRAITRRAGRMGRYCWLVTASSPAGLPAKVTARYGRQNLPPYLRPLPGRSAGHQKAVGRLAPAGASGGWHAPARARGRRSLPPGRLIGPAWHSPGRTCRECAAPLTPVARAETGGGRETRWLCTRVIGRSVGRAESAGYLYSTIGGLAAVAHLGWAETALGYFAHYL